VSDPATAARARSGVGALLYAVLTMGIGYWFGGAAALGRLDAALLIPTLPFAAMAMLALKQVRPVGRIWAILLPTALLLILAFVAFGTTSPHAQWPQLAALGIVSILLLALLGAVHRAVASRAAGVRWSIMAALAGASWLAAHVALGAVYSAQPAAQPGRVVALTGLPLRTWGQDDLSLGAMQDAAALVVLRQRLSRPLVLMDRLAPASLNQDDRLLLAHPLALPPETLVEVDRFVRAGGRAVILADGLSSWPPPHRFGDPRNPPVTSLLTPLLDHWGVRLDAPIPEGANSDSVAVEHQGHRLTLHSPGHFATLPKACRGAGLRPDGQPTIATCRIGRGTAVLLADADLLFDPLWRPEPLWAAHLRRSDNIEWLAGQLNEPDRPAFWGLRPTWR
jgi:hypothetical protein